MTPQVPGYTTVQLLADTSACSHCLNIYAIAGTQAGCPNACNMHFPPAWSFERSGDQMATLGSNIGPPNPQCARSPRLMAGWPAGGPDPAVDGPSRAGARLLWQCCLSAAGPWRWQVLAVCAAPEVGLLDLRRCACGPAASVKLALRQRRSPPAARGAGHGVMDPRGPPRVALCRTDPCERARVRAQATAPPAPAPLASTASAAGA